MNVSVFWKMKKEKEALEEMAYRIHGIAQFAEYLPPEKDKGELLQRFVRWPRSNQQRESTTKRHNSSMVRMEEGTVADG